MDATTNQRQTRRAFLANSAKTATLAALFPLAAQSAKAACSFPYGSGPYGHSCYTGEPPKLLLLPATQNIPQNGFRFYLKGEASRAYRIEYSSDLTHWTTMAILFTSSDGAAMEIVDTQAKTTVRRWYRAKPL